MLAHSGITPLAPDQVDVVWFWKVPGPMSAVYSYIGAHPPAGSLTPAGQGFFTIRGRPLFSFWQFGWPPARPLSNGPIVVVETTPLKDGSTGVRGDGYVVWHSPVPPPPLVRSARLLLVTAQIARFGPSPTTFRLKRFSIRSAKRIQAVAALLNAMRPLPFVLSCLGTGPQPVVTQRVLERLELVFYVRGARRARVWVDGTPGGFCGHGASFKVTVRGSRARYLFDYQSFRPIVAALGLTIHAKQSFP